MSISSISSTPASAAALAAQANAKRAPDGDSALVEAQESRSLQKTEQLNGGFAPKATSTQTPGGVNTLA